jgi:hypothetical protein
MRYKLTAQLGRRKSQAIIIAADSMVATLDAVDIIIQRAARFPTGPWALGRIVLKDCEGKIIHSMNAKAPA